MRQDPYAILLQTKEALFPASHIPKSRSSFKPPPAKKQKKTNQPMAKNNTPSTTLHMLEEQIEIARKVMNSKVKEVEQVQVPMHPIIRNPEAISDDEIPDAEVEVPQMQQAAQVQVPQMQQAAQVIHPQVQKLRITQPNPPILKFTTGLAICMCAGCRNTITRDQKTYP